MKKFIETHKLIVFFVLLLTIGFIIVLYFTAPPEAAQEQLQQSTTSVVIQPITGDGEISEDSHSQKSEVGTSLSDGIANPLGDGFSMSKPTN